MTEWLRSRSRAWKVLAAIGALSSVALAFVPLFNLIGYESAAFYGVLFGLTVSYLGFDDLGWRGWARGLRDRLALALLPFVVLSVNALFVKNCAYLTGVLFWVLIVVGSIAVATTLGWFVRNLVESPRRGDAWIAVVTLATVADFGLRLAFEPPIIGHHWFLGYFSGSIYDEALNVPTSLVWYRVVHVVAIAALVAGVTAFRSRSRSHAAVAVVLVAAAVAGFTTRQSFGVDLDRVRIIEALGGRVESENFIIYYPASPPYSNDVDRLVEDHEFRYAEMKAYFGTDPVALRGEKVKSFVYANRDQKGALMGARRTLVAKIWLREMHILWRHYGDHMLAHELAHVFTEPFGTGPLRLSSRFWFFTNMGLVEGVATAADWDTDDLDPHRASAALRRLGRAPDITGLVGASGFWTQSAGRAYTLMGSFVQWLIDEHGIEKFREAYGHGEFEKVYGTPPQQLVASWEAFVDAIELDPHELELARYFYDRQSIFQKVCARTIGDLRLRAVERARAHDARAARALMAEILSYDPDNVDYRVEQAELLLALGDGDAAVKLLRGLLEGELDAAQEARVRALLGDALWRVGDTAAAAARYRECLDGALPVASRRLLEVKHVVLQGDQHAEPFAYHYLLEPTVGDDIRLFFPAEWARQHPDDPHADYLIGRRLWAAGQWGWAEPYLRRALEVSAPVLRDEASLMLLQTLHFGGQSEQARAVLDDWSPQSGTYHGARDEWRRRLDWSSSLE